MQPSSIILMLLLVPSGLAAQSTPNRTAAVFTTPPTSESCPVNFSVERKPNSGMVMVKGAAASHGQGLQINFIALPESAILKVHITVHGMTPGVRVIPASSRIATRDDATETFVLSAEPDSPLLHPAIWTKRLNAVTWVELTRIEYANGTTWQASQQSRCAAAPSLLVLVDSTR
jgi:hypothetical protein